jgi:hypothetical protein
MENTRLNGLRKVSHLLCKGCHSEEREKGRTAAPARCGGCHIGSVVSD